MLHKSWFAGAYWVAALVMTALAGALGSQWAVGQAPTFTDEDKGSVPANGASHLLYGIFGGVLAALAVLAVFAAGWLFLWVRERRRTPVQDDLDDENTFSVDDMENMLE